MTFALELEDNIGTDENAVTDDDNGILTSAALVAGCYLKTMAVTAAGHYFKEIIPLYSTSYITHV